MPLWLVYSMTAALFYGLLNFLYKVSAEKKLPTQAVVFVSAFSVVISTAVTIKAKGGTFESFGQALPYAAVNGTLFAFGALAKFRALKLAPASVVFPVNKSNVLFVIVIGLVFFKELPTLRQWTGVFAAILVLVLISYEQIKGTRINKLQGIGFALVAALCTSFSMTAGKLASLHTDRLTYILISYSIVTVIAFVLYRFRVQEEKRITSFKNPFLFILGGGIGILNFAGYNLVLKAFAEGSMALVQPVFALSILIPIFLSAIIYREHLTFIRIVSIALSLASILLIKSG